MLTRCSLFLVVVALIAGFSSTAQGAVLCSTTCSKSETGAPSLSFSSDESDGSFFLGRGQLLELPGDRIYNYSTFTIEPDARLNFRSLTSDTTVQLRVTGDVTIAGAIDVGPGSLTITSPGSITFLNGSRLAGGAIHLWSNQIDISSGAVVALVNSGEITLAPVPLPGALALFTPALLGLGFFATRSRQSK